MSRPEERLPSIRYYFVDEAGDGTLFSKRGRVIVGMEGCSHFFILGLLDVPDTESLAREMEELRAGLLADPYFRGVPSMQPEAKKTALAFHAKDDLPEVRREVFNLLLRHNLRFFAVVRDKRNALQRALEAARHRFCAQWRIDFTIGIVVSYIVFCKRKVMGRNFGSYFYFSFFCFFYQGH